MKREVIEGDKAAEAQKLVSRAANKALRQRKARGDASEIGVVSADEPPGETSPSDN